MQLSAEDVAAASSRIADRLIDFLSGRQFETLHTFIRLIKFNEIDTSVIYFRLWKDLPDVTTIAPRIVPGTTELEHIPIDARTELIENQWGVREPSGETRFLATEIDVVLVPLLCFDRRGFRVGYGGGFYDRFLNECRADCLKIGLSFWPPIDNVDDSRDEDIILDACITPHETYLLDLLDHRMKKASEDASIVEIKTIQ